MSGCSYFLPQFQPQYVLILFLLKLRARIGYFNIEFDDGTSDYIEHSDTGNVEIILFCIKHDSIFVYTLDKICFFLLFTDI